MRRALLTCCIVVAALTATDFAADQAATPITPRPSVPGEMSAVNEVYGGVPCICPLWPFDTIVIENTTYYVYYAERYDVSDPDCLNPIASYYIGPDSLTWPYLCDDCLASAKSHYDSKDGNKAEKKPCICCSAPIVHPGIPAEKNWDHKIAFPQVAEYERNAAKVIYEDFAEFTDESGRPHRAKLFLIKCSPVDAKRLGPERFFGIGYEVEKVTQSEPKTA